MQPTMSHALVLVVVIGWMAVSSPLLVAARDTHMGHPLFGGGDAAGGNPKEFAAADDISSHGRGADDISSSSSSSSSFLGAAFQSNIGDDSSTGDGDGGGSSGDDNGSGGSASGGSNSSGSSGNANIIRRNLRRDDDDIGDGDVMNDREIGHDSNGPAPTATNVHHDPAADTPIVYNATGAEPVLEDPSFVNDWDADDKSCPRFNLTLLPRVCSVLRRVCMFQETLITHDWRYSYANPRREPLPDMPWVENWNFPAAVGTNTDALKGRGSRYRLHLRPASAYEPTEALRNPVFSNRTLPLVIVADFPFNMGEFFAKVVSAVDHLAMDERATLVLQTPMGLNLAAFHSLLLMSYSRYPVITTSDLGDPGCTEPRVSGSASVRAGRRGGSGRSFPWSSEAVPPHCFQRMIMCKWDLQTGGGTALARVASRVVAAFVRADLLPPSPVRFPGGSGSSGARGSETDPDQRGTTTLRVLIETRQGPVRNIKNMEDLLAACKELDRNGFTAGSFRRIYCTTTSFSEADGSVDRSRFLANVAAVRSAHVLVVMHGAGATNSWFMRQGSSALVELRPCGFGTHFSPWPDKYMPKQHEKNDDVIRFFALNVEDQTQCFHGDIETSLRNRTAKRNNVGWDAAYFARDQHLALKPAPFLEFIRHVGELLLDVEAYRAKREGDRLHGYIVPEGLMYGKLGIMKLDEFRSMENPPVISFP